MQTATVSGTHRPLAVACLLLALLALRMTTAAGATPSAAPSSQALVSLRSAHHVYAQSSPNTKLLATLPARTPITESPTTLPLLQVRGGWLLVRLPGRPNGHSGWIRSVWTSRSVSFWHIYVKTGAETVTVDWGGRPVRTFRAVVGKPSTPTPNGQFFVEETVALSSSSVGAPFALALSARSNIFQEFDGGPGQIAIHGLDNVGGTPGTAVSHGCIRVTDSDVRWLAARIGAGVPVTISP
jgi:hypothetical protein